MTTITTRQRRRRLLTVTLAVLAVLALYALIAGADWIAQYAPLAALPIAAALLALYVKLGRR